MFAVLSTFCCQSKDRNMKTLIELSESESSLSFHFESEDFA